MDYFYVRNTLPLLMCFAAFCVISAQQPPATVSPVGVGTALNVTVPPGAATTAAAATNGTRGGCGGKKKKGRESRDVFASIRLQDDEEPHPRKMRDTSKKTVDENVYQPLLRLSKRSPKKSVDSSSSEESTKDTPTKINASNSTSSKA